MLLHKHTDQVNALLKFARTTNKTYEPLVNVNKNET